MLHCSQRILISMCVMIQSVTQKCTFSVSRSQYARHINWLKSEWWSYWKIFAVSHDNKRQQMTKGSYSRVPVFWPWTKSWTLTDLDDLSSTSQVGQSQKGQKPRQRQTLGPVIQRGSLRTALASYWTVSCSTSWTTCFSSELSPSTFYIQIKHIQFNIKCLETYRSEEDHIIRIQL